MVFRFGNYTIIKKVPDTITSWYLSAFTTNPINGLGLRQQHNAIIVFQPFFLSLHLPYSIKRGESVKIDIIVFNYMKTSQNVEVSLYNSKKEFDVEDSLNERQGISR